jgi:hypothetical protein
MSTQSAETPVVAALWQIIAQALRSATIDRHVQQARPMGASSKPIITFTHRMPWNRLTSVLRPVPSFVALSTMHHQQRRRHRRQI